MPFKKMTERARPPRHWGLVGYPGSGKSTFAARMRGPLLVVDADHRFTEVQRLASEVYELSSVPADNADPDRISSLLNANMPDTPVGTIVIDSLTAIIAPKVVQAMIDKDLGREKSLASAFRGKALAMRQLQDAVTRWGTDTLWIYHLHDARDEKANQVTKATVSPTELIRLTRSINAQLEVVQGGDGKRGIKVVWSRRGRDGITVWDEAGYWKGMPEKLEAAMFDGLSDDEQDQKEKGTPKAFQSPELAIAWAVNQGAFDEISHARNAYAKVKRDKQPQTAQEMAAAWIAEVQLRLLWSMAAHFEATKEEVEDLLLQCNHDAVAALEMLKTRYAPSEPSAVEIDDLADGHPIDTGVSL